MKWEDIERLALHDPIVRAWMSMYRSEGLTQEETLCGIVASLCSQNRKLTDVLVEIQIRTPTPPIRVNHTRFVPEEG